MGISISGVCISWNLQEFQDKHPAYSPQPTKMTLTGTCISAASCDLALHVIAQLMKYCAMFEKSWKALSDFIEKVPELLVDPDWIFYYILVPVNTIVGDARANINAHNMDSQTRSKMLNFLTNQFLCEYLKTIIHLKDYATKESFQKLRYGNNKDLFRLMTLPTAGVKHNTKYKERDVDTVLKALCIMYVYHIQDCKSFCPS